MEEGKKENLLRYNRQLWMLKQLLKLNLITKTEYDDNLKKLQKDYGIVSHLTAN